MNPFLCIIGSHADVAMDMDAMPKNVEWDYMAIGPDAVNKYAGKILYVATYHPDEVGLIRDRRLSVSGNLDYTVIGHDKRDGVDIVISDWWRPSGSSSLLGTQAALRLGYTRIVLCGCPLTGSNANGSKYEGFRDGWKARKNDVAPYVRSISGWTADILGKPSPEWVMVGS